jgi:hypothetical protein
MRKKGQGSYLVLVGFEQLVIASGGRLGYCPQFRETIRVHEIPFVGSQGGR